MGEFSRHFAIEYHHRAATHQNTAARHHHQAAHCHEIGQHDAAKVEAKLAQEQSEWAHIHSATAFVHSFAAIRLDEAEPSFDILIASVRIAFTPRERDVLSHLKLGKPNKLIAYELNISHSTIKVHMHNLMRKFNVQNRTQLVVAIQKQIEP
jgi:DNA-binding NarL/FixJ family response regulator